MSYTELKGSQCWIETARAAAKNITGITNAAPPEVTSAVHGYMNGDPILQFIEQWEDFNNIVVQVSNKDDDTYEVADFDTTSTNDFPASGDSGTAHKITFGMKIGQILECTSEGGELKSETIDPWDRKKEIEFFTGETATKIRMVLGYDGQSAAQKALLAASNARLPKAFKFVMGATTVYGYGRIWAAKVPVFGPTVLRRNLAFAFLGDATTFATA